MNWLPSLASNFAVNRCHEIELPHRLSGDCDHLKLLWPSPRDCEQVIPLDDHESDTFRSKTAERQESVVVSYVKHSGAEDYQIIFEQLVQRAQR